MQYRAKDATSLGRKAAIEKPKLLMRGEAPVGSAIRLSPVNEIMGAAEGIETARSAERLFGVPTWSLVHAAGVERFTPPASVKELWVFGDHDANYTSQAASFVLARRMVTAKLTVHVEIPPSVGDDWNDVLMRQAQSMRA